jgi:hypothetical protein
MVTIYSKSDQADIRLEEIAVILAEVLAARSPEQEAPAESDSQNPLE